MKTYKLEIDYDYDFELLGIRCAEEMYRLAYLLNKTLSTKFEKSLTPAKYFEGKESIDCGYFSWFDEQYDAEWYLISNRLSGAKETSANDPIDLFSGTTEMRKIESRLSREHQQVDYFVQIFGMVPRDLMEKMLSLGKELDELQTIMQLDVPNMRDRDNFLMIEYANKS
jgi:hypothetical protein